MTTKKTYVIPGFNSVKLTFFLNGSNARFHVEFSGGSTYNNVPASFSTTDPACQAAIEEDVRFGSRIVLKSVYNFEDGTGEQLPDSPKPQSLDNSAGPDPTVVDDVTDMNGVVAYLKDNYGISGASLRTLNAVRKKVKDYNLSFPNVPTLFEE